MKSEEIKPTQIDTKSPLNNIFSLFCSTDPFRPNILNPFTVGYKTYATDGIALVRCDNDKIDFEFKNFKKPPDVESVIPEINTSEIINIDDIDWIGLMTEDEMISEDSVECGHCDGYGVYGDNFIYKGKVYDFEYECPVCDGSGYEEEGKQIPTGNKIFSQNSMVKLKDIYFYTKNFYRLKQVKDLIGGDIELISYNTSKGGVMFRIDFLEILIMPCTSSYDDYVIANIS